MGTRKWLWQFAIVAAICAGLGGQLAWGLIERPLSLASLLADSDTVFVGKIERVNPDRPSLVMNWDRDLKGKFEGRRLPVNLTGDKEKHTADLLRRVAADLPVVVFVTNQEDKQLALVYTNGTWFQMIGTKSGDETRWAFTHCEIYLRRTFKGTTKEMIDTVTGVVAGKLKPPPLNSKEKPGLGPEVEKPDAKPDDAEKKAQSFLRERGATDYRWGVIALPFLAPLAALLQLLFPGLLRDHWKRYRVVISILMTQSTLITLHWVVLRWFVKERSWWLMDDMLWAALVVVSLLGAIVACVMFALAAPEKDRNVIRPAPVEYLALGSLLLAGLAWGCWLMWTGSSPFDQMAVVWLGALAAWMHLLYRGRTASSGRAMFLTTELVFLWGLVFAGAGLGVYLNTQQANLTAGEVSAEWPLFRGHPQRNGAVDVNDAGPRKPAILWTFDPAERKGRVRLHSSPTVVNGQVYIGGLHEVQTLAQGYLYCVHAGSAPAADARKPGERIWRFSAGGSLKPVFASPSVAGGKVYFGEGYHQDQACRMFCLDAQNADEPLWSFLASSHVESSPCLLGNRIYFGAGDDGVYCLELPQGSGEPRKLWQHADVHVDGAPVVADGRVLVGSVLGDIKQEFQALALDAETGEVRWKLDAPMPVAGSATVSADAVYFGLGNGKFDHDADSPAGSVWKIDLASGKKAWEFPLNNAVLGTPVVDKELVIFGSRDQHCYAVDQSSGKSRWKLDLGAPVVASPIVAGGKVYALAVTGSLACIDEITGNLEWRFDELSAPDEDAYSSPTLANGRLYVAVAGKLYCLGDAP